MSRLDEHSVLEHLAALEEAIEALERMAGWSSAEIGADAHRLWALEHGFQLAAQNVVDVASHMTTALRAGTAPEDYRGAILALGELGVVEASLAVALAPLAGLRNLLVHNYLRVDVERLHGDLQRLDDLRGFIAAIRAFLAANPGL